MIKSKKIVYTERDIDLSYFVGVFNVSGIEGLTNELQRLKKLHANPHDIFNFLSKEDEK